MRQVVLGLLVLMLSGLLALSPNSGPAYGQERKTLIVTYEDDPETLDPALNVRIVGRMILRNLYEGLVDVDADSGGRPRFVPGLATSWRISSDGKEYTFSLRRNVKFHDGTLMDADAVKYSLERYKAVPGGETGGLRALSSVSVVDRNTVKLTLSRPDINFLDLLYWAMIVSPSAFKANEGGDLARRWAADSAVGTGPYKLEEWRRRDRLLMIRHQDYWRGWRAEQFYRVAVVYAPEPSTRKLMIERGDVHVARAMPPTDIPALERNPDLKIMKSRTALQWYFGFNAIRGPASDVRVRRAISYAYPQAKVIEALEGLPAPTNGPIPQALVGSFPADMPRYPYDLDRAKQLLADAGYSGKPLSLQLVYYAPFKEQEIAGQLLQAELRKIGVDLRLEGATSQAVVNELVNDRDKTPDMWGHVVFPNTLSPGGALRQLFHSKEVGAAGGRNWGFYSNPRFDELLDRADATLDAGSRSALYLQAVRLIAEDAPRISLFLQVEAIPMRKWVQGYRHIYLRRDGWSFYELFSTR